MTQSQHRRQPCPQDFQVDVSVTFLGSPRFCKSCSLPFASLSLALILCVRVCARVCARVRYLLSRVRLCTRAPVPGMLTLETCRRDAEGTPRGEGSGLRTRAGRGTGRGVGHPWGGTQP